MWETLTERLKDLRHGLLWTGMAALTAIAAFGIGRATAPKPAKETLHVTPLQAPKSIQIGEETGQNTAVSMPIQERPHTFVASINGSKYYPDGCSAANRIKPENKVWFATAEEAQKAGYSASAYCQQ